MLSFCLAAASIACILMPAATAIPTIHVKGSKFFADGEQFFLKGVAYQGTPADPLVDAEQCRHDAKLMQSIGVNSIRVYHADPFKNHDGCMKIFEDAGIYIWLDMETFDTSITQQSPKWTLSMFMQYMHVIDTFQRYDNLGGFWIGNENINSKNGSLAAPYIKAAAADMKSYLLQAGYRTIPIGYSAADIAELRPMLQNYLICGTKPTESIDFFGLNSYEWCGEATYDTSGYVWLQEITKDYPVPVFFSETGCNVGGERTFRDQAAIFGPKMSETWSGSIIYEWVEETNHYGLVTYPNGKIYSGAPIPVQPDFSNLDKQWKDVVPSGVKEASYSPSLSIPPCPAPTDGWLVNGDVPLPRVDSMYIKAAADTVPKPKYTSTSSPTLTTSPSAPIGRPNIKPFLGSPITSTVLLVPDLEYDGSSSTTYTMETLEMPKPSSTAESHGIQSQTVTKESMFINPPPKLTPPPQYKDESTRTAKLKSITTGSNPSATSTKSAGSRIVLRFNRNAPMEYWATAVWMAAIVFGALLIIGFL